MSSIVLILFLLIIMVGIIIAVSYAISRTEHLTEMKIIPFVDLSIANFNDLPPRLVDDEMLKSQVCTSEQFKTPIYKFWIDEMKEPHRFHRKQWEFVYILKALSERGMLKPGKKGIGFGVGQEPLPAIMAKYGVDVLATDLAPSQAEKAGWLKSGQYLDSLEKLNERRICDPRIFSKRVKWEYADMNSIPPEYNSQFDFVWSSCALEHTGSLQSGLKFIENSMGLLKPGGVAVHTTEFNLSSNNQTIEIGGSVIYRRQDIEKLVKTLRNKGYLIDINLYFDNQDELDRHIDAPPYSDDTHIRLDLENYVSTSIGLIIQKR